MHFILCQPWQWMTQSIMHLSHQISGHENTLSSVSISDNSGMKDLVPWQHANLVTPSSVLYFNPNYGLTWWIVSTNRLPFLTLNAIHGNESFSKGSSRESFWLVDPSTTTMLKLMKSVVYLVNEVGIEVSLMWWKWLWMAWSSLQQQQLSKWPIHFWLNFYDDL